MYQITDWLVPNVKFFIKDRLVSNKDWLEEFKRFLEEAGRKSEIREMDIDMWRGKKVKHLAVFSELPPGMAYEIELYRRQNEYRQKRKLEKKK